MSASTIQSQMGYAAQASPVASFLTPASTSPDRIPFAISLQDAQSDMTRSQRVALSGSGDITPAPQPQDESRVTRKTDIDWTTNSLVYRMIDSRSGQVVSQSPDEALLRMRAYARQVETQSANADNSSQSVSREL